MYILHTRDGIYMNLRQVLFEAYSILFEATNINKKYLIQQASTAGVDINDITRIHQIFRWGLI